MLLEVRDIEVVYDKVILALKGVSLAVLGGSIVTMLGANGAGKSTTLKAISGLISQENGRITRGEVWFDGKRVDGLSPVEMAKLGVCQVMEGREVFPGLTVEENLRVGALLRGNPRAAHPTGGPRLDSRAIQANYDLIYRYFPVLKDRRRQLAGYLSGGEQQMLAIGRALMTRPRLLLLDEPSLGLAPLLARNVYEIVKLINQEQGTTVLLVEQTASIALPVSDYAYVLANGQIVLEGPGHDVAKKDIRGIYLGRKGA